jgi:hypothetical protein
VDRESARTDPQIKGCEARIWVLADGLEHSCVDEQRDCNGQNSGAFDKRGAMLPGIHRDTEAVVAEVCHAKACVNDGKRECVNEIVNNTEHSAGQVIQCVKT